jgi:hypothetical protein
MRKALRRLKGYTGRVLRDIERQMEKGGRGTAESADHGDDIAGKPAAGAEAEGPP